MLIRRVQNDSLKVKDILRFAKSEYGRKAITAAQPWNSWKSYNLCWLLMSYFCLMLFLLIAMYKVTDMFFDDNFYFSLALAVEVLTLMLIKRIAASALQKKNPEFSLIALTIAPYRKEFNAFLEKEKDDKSV